LFSFSEFSISSNAWDMNFRRRCKRQRLGRDFTSTPSQEYLKSLITAMSSFTFLGREYMTDEFLKDIVGQAALLAKNARIDDQPLPPDTDLTQTEQDKVGTQVSIDLYITSQAYPKRVQLHAILVLPRFAIDDFWSAFTANHLSALTSAIRALSFRTQRQALSTLVQILSLLPDPSVNPYLRRFLCQSSQSNGLATLVSDAFVRSIAWKRPSGPGQISSLIINLFVWNDTSRGDDGKAPVDADVRRALVERLDILKASPRYDQIEETQRVQMERLWKMLNAIENTQGDLCLSTTRQLLEQALDRCTNPSCGKDADLTCSRCKSMRYCGIECQKWHWRNGHKLRCFQTTF
jgi:hypothetical protein